MKTEIINIGDELLIGQVVNTNASWMAEKMNLAGFAITRITSIKDDEQDITDVLDECAKRSDIVIVTGGLGPTKDDITKKSFCRYFDTDLVFNEEIYQNIERIFIERKYVMTALNRAQAEVPANCIPLNNRNGTAPGMWFEHTRKDDGRKLIFVSLPGVPFEMKALMEEEVIPRLKTIFHPHVILHKTIMTQGVGESFLSDLIEKWELQLPENIKLAYLPQPGMVRLRMTGTGEDRNNLSDQIQNETEKLRDIIKDHIYGEDDDSLEEVVGKLLRDRTATLAVAESCTGGYLGHLITTIPGSSDYFLGGVISYSNEIKKNELGVKEESLIKNGAVSEQVVKEMAEGVKKKFGSTYSVATSGIAGPGGGTAEKPVGLIWIAVSSPSGTHVSSYFFGDNRERNIRRAGLQALSLLRRQILKDRE